VVNHIAVVALKSLASHSAQSLTLSNDLLTVYKVARGFKSLPLRQAVGSKRSRRRAPPNFWLNAERGHLDRQLHYMRLLVLFGVHECSGPDRRCAEWRKSTRPRPGLEKTL
jgi:hypothetical protein